MQALLQGVPLVDGHNDLMIHFHGCRDGCPRGLDGYAIRDVAGIDQLEPQYAAALARIRDDREDR